MFLLSAVLYLAAQTAPSVHIPPANTGVINGRTAILVWPADSSNHPIEATGCDVHLVPYVDQNIEQVYPCGEWFQPDVGKYRYWLEKDGSSITPYPSILTYVGRKFEGNSLQVLLPVVPAAQVGLRRPQSHDVWLRILHLPAPSDHPATHRSFDRRARGDRIEPLLVPEGSLIAGLFDREGNAIALTHPVHAARGQLIRVLPAPPSKGTDVLAVLERDALRENKPEYDARVVLRLNGEARAPDVVSDTASRVVCIWYGVSARQAEFVFGSNREFIATEPVRLRSGTVVTLRRRVARLPDLHVMITAPKVLKNSKIKVLSLDESSAPLRMVDGTAGETLIPFVPAEELVVVFEQGAWRFRKSVDLRNGSDATVQFDLKPVRVTGTIYRGDTPSSGTVTFTTGTKDLATTTADDAGRYSVDLWASGAYVTRVEMPATEPFLKGFVEVDGDTTVDFHVPMNRFRVLVSDEKSGAPIENAIVSVTNVESAQSAVRQVESRRTDGSGVATLPPLKHGRASIEAFANGYQRAAAVECVIDSDTRSRDVNIRLEPAAGDFDVTVSSAVGLPAVGAELAILPADSIDGIPVWRGVYSDDNGMHVPDIGRRALLLVRAHGSASEVVALPPAGNSLAVRLAPQAPPLVVEALTTSGERVPWARIALWFDQYRMWSASLGFLTWSQGAASSDGVWVANGLKAGAIRAVAWRGNSSPAGTFDALSHVVAFPWRDVDRLVVVN